MATSKDFIGYISERFNGNELTFRPMMGEYLVYYKGKLVGDACDNRLLIKPVESVKAFLPDAEYQPPYDGARPLILVENIDDGEFLRALFEKMYPELPEPKTKKKVNKK